MTKTVIIDYGMSNLGSVKRSFEECGANVVVSEKPSDLSDATQIVLPGVGAFVDGINNLQSSGWIDPLKRAVLEDRVPLLGICLGMQLLAEVGYEGKGGSGLGFIPGKVCRFEPDSPKIRVPHVGWNEVQFKEGVPLFSNIPFSSDFYFVHSYHFVTAQPEHVIATTPYCNNFTSAVRLDNIYGVQFHPEKSSRFGFQLIKNFLKS